MKILASGRPIGTSLVVAARAGDPRALDELVTAALPLVYAIVRRALSGYPDIDDVVQETIIRVLRDLPLLRSPESFRPWLASIAMRRVSTYLARQDVAAARTVALDELAEEPDADADIEGPALLRVHLSGQRRQVVRAGRWLDPDDRILLSLWWQEVTGRLTRTELAAALDMSVAHAGVSVQRMRNQLELSRSIVAALDARPGCAELAAVVADWDGVPSPLWRKRIARHIRSCPVCPRAATGLIAPERLILGFALIPVPAQLAAALTGSALTGTAIGTASVSGATAAAGSSAVGSGIKAGILSQLAQAIGAHPVAAVVAAGTLAAGAGATTAAWPDRPPPAVVIAAPTPTPATPTTASPRARATSIPEHTSPAPTAKPSGTTAPRLAPGRLSLESVNRTGLMITTTDALGVLRSIDPDGPPAERQLATFEVVPGLANRDCVSLRTDDGRYVRHASWRVQVGRDEGTNLYRADATFCVRAGSAPGSVALQSFNYPSYYLRHRGNELWVDQTDGSKAFAADSSFLRRAPLSP